VDRVHAAYARWAKSGLKPTVSAESHTAQRYLQIFACFFACLAGNAGLGGPCGLRRLAAKNHRNPRITYGLVHTIDALSGAGDAMISSLGHRLVSTGDRKDREVLTSLMMILNKGKEKGLGRVDSVHIYPPTIIENNSTWQQWTDSID